MKVAVITAIISREFEDMPEKQLEGWMRIYLKMEDIPFCERIEKVKVSSVQPDEGYSL